MDDRIAGDAAGLPVGCEEHVGVTGALVGADVVPPSQRALIPLKVPRHPRVRVAGVDAGGVGPEVEILPGGVLEEGIGGEVGGAGRRAYVSPAWVVPDVVVGQGGGSARGPDTARAVVDDDGVTDDGAATREVEAAASRRPGVGDEGGVKDAGVAAG